MINGMRVDAGMSERRWTGVGGAGRSFLSHKSDPDPNKKKMKRRVRKHEKRLGTSNGGRIGFLHREEGDSRGDPQWKRNSIFLFGSEWKRGNGRGQRRKKENLPNRGEQVT